MKALAASLAIAVPLVAILIVVVTVGGLPRIPLQTQSCTLSPGSQCSVTFKLQKDNQVSGSVSIKDNSAGETNFWVTDPSGANIYSGKIISVTSFLFTATGAGAYVIHFNTLVSSLMAKLVTLSYNVASPIDC